MEEQHGDGSHLRRVDLRWIVPDRLAVEVNGETVTIHQRNHISREKWNTLIMRAADLRSAAAAID